MNPVRSQVAIGGLIAAWMILLALAVLLPPRPAAASSEEVLKAVRSLAPPQRKSFLEDGARKEGQVVWYTSMSLSDYPKIAALFEKAYPFIKTNTYRATTVNPATLGPGLNDIIATYRGIFGLEGAR